LDTLIVGDGEAPSRALVERLFRDRPGAPVLVIAADGGALKAEALGLRPNLVVGDLDSLPAADVARLRRQDVPVLSFPAGKDESDTELAVREAISRGAQRLVLIGALGGRRIEHSLANVLLLTMPELAALDAAIVDGPSTLRALGSGERRRLELHGAAGDYVSLLPLSERVEGVTTSGLAYELDDEELRQGPARGLSNELTGDHATISTRRGRLLVVHTSRAVASR
jgi:thiamine pyrophosphokinase